MSANKIGSPFESVWGDHTISWNGEFVMVGYAQQTYATQVIKAAIEAWTPTPPEGWEEYPEGEKLGKPEGLFNPLTGKVLAVNEHGNARLSETMWASYSDCTTLGFVPVRKVKPAVPEWAKNLKNGLRGIDEDYWGDYLAKYCVPKADADEMLGLLKELAGGGVNVMRLNALIERMEGKR